MNSPELPGITLTFLYYFSTTALIALLVFSQGLRLGFDSAIAYQAASGLALLAGIIGTIQNRGITRQLSVKKNADCERALVRILDQRGFTEREPWQDFTAYRPARGRSWGRSRIFVKWEGRTLTLSGRAHLVRSLQSELAEFGVTPPTSS